MILKTIYQRIFYEANWAYLSTLGGAYSSLGEEDFKHVCPKSIEKKMAHFYYIFL